MSSPRLAPRPAPENLHQLGIRRTLLEELALRTLFVLGEMALGHLAAHMRLNLGLVEELFQRLRKDQLCEVTGIAGGVHRVVTVTAQGAGRAQQLLSVNGYIGPAPVSLSDYVVQVKEQSVRDVDVHPEDLVRAFNKLVLEERTLRQLGTAVVSGRTIFLYGPPGTGKTSIAETLADLFKQHQVWIPHAVEVDGQIVCVFDPMVHREIELPVSADVDRRWVLCERPRVLVGGELTIEMLDLQFNASNYYAAPVQMKANNGLLIVDDFGRQRIRPDELLNRWVVPLDRRIDYLTLAGGRKLEIPFDVFVVFATNIDPARLADEAFLRRIQTKVKVDCVTPQQFHDIFRRVCSSHDVAYDEAVCARLIEIIQGQYAQPLRPCHPRDIVEQICWSAKYEKRSPALTQQAIADACFNYFVSE